MPVEGAIGLGAVGGAPVAVVPVWLFAPVDTGAVELGVCVPPAEAAAAVVGSFLFAAAIAAASAAFLAASAVTDPPIMSIIPPTAPGITVGV